MNSLNSTAIDASSFDSAALDFSKGENSTGLLPAVVVHAATGQVLMVAWCNKQAVEQTLATGKVTFYSRSRQQLWTKGETSGNTLLMQSMVSDCDNDTLLIGALPRGPVCHTGASTCFEANDNLRATTVKNSAQHSEVCAPGNFLHQLETIIAARANADQSSYTASLLTAGVARIAQKVGEEGVEVALAGALEDRENLKNESADLLYHLLVLLKANNLPLSDVLIELQRRHHA